MKNNNFISYILIILGGIIAFYANAEKQQNTIILVVGIILLMYGVFRLTQTIPSKNDKNEDLDNNEEH